MQFGQKSMDRMILDGYQEQGMEIVGPRIIQHLVDQGNMMFMFMHI